MKSTSPFAIGILIIFIIGLVMQVPFDEVITEDHFSSFQIEYVPLTFKMSIILTIGLAAIRRFQTQTLAGLSSNNKWSHKLLNLIPIYLFIMGIATFIGKDLMAINISDLFLLLLACLAVGFAEEFVFRGLLQSIFIRKYINRRNGVFLGVLYPAIFFGASHLLNLTVNDNIPQVIVQAIYAIFIGFFFGVVLLKTNKLLPLAVTHGLINFFFLINSLPGLIDATEVGGNAQIEPTSLPQIIAPIVIFLPLFVVGLIVLRKIEKDSILEKVEEPPLILSGTKQS